MPPCSQSRLSSIPGTKGEALIPLWNQGPCLHVYLFPAPYRMDSITKRWPMSRSRQKPFDALQCLAV